MPKHVFITGGTGGIGRSLVAAFSKAGYQVSFTYHSSQETALTLEQEYQAKGFLLDFADSSQVCTFAKELEQKSGPVDVLINNAAVSHYGLFQDVTMEEFQKLFAINFQTPFFLTGQFVPSMVSAKSGTIINIASVWGETGGSCEVLYSSAKGAMIAFTKALAKELAPSGISVNCISPGVVDTAMMDRFSREEKELLMEEIPAGHFTGADEIAALALYLSENSSTSLTGQILGINGGMYC